MLFKTKTRYKSGCSFMLACILLITFDQNAVSDLVISSSFILGQSRSRCCQSEWHDGWSRRSNSRSSWCWRISACVNHVLYGKVIFKTHKFCQCRYYILVLEIFSCLHIDSVFNEAFFLCLSFTPLVYWEVYLTS